MTIVALPIASGETELDQALSLMKNARRSAVLLQDGPEAYRLLDAADVVHGSNRQVVTLNDLVRGGTSVVVKALPARGRWTTRVRGMVFVEIANDHLAGRVAAEVRLYYCDGPRRHGFLPGEVVPGQECPENDGGIIQS